MVAIPLRRSPTIDAIYTALEASRDTFDNIGVGFSSAGNPCDRAIWLSLRWASHQKPMDGQKISVVNRGTLEEDRACEDLTLAGCLVYDRQKNIRLADGWLRGKIDGVVSGLIEAPKTDHLLEIKCTEQKSFTPLRKKGVKEAREGWWAQMQLGMAGLGLDRAVFFVRNRNTEEIHIERIAYDQAYTASLIARTRRIVSSDKMPPKIDDNPKMPPCVWCEHRAFCFEESTDVRSNCRTCAFSTFVSAGDAHCSRFDKPLSVNAQKDGCPAHLFHPELIHGTIVARGPDPLAPEWIEYERADGTRFYDGVM